MLETCDFVIASVFLPLVASSIAIFDLPVRSLLCAVVPRCWHRGDGCVFMRQHIPQGQNQAGSSSTVAKLLLFQLRPRLHLSGVQLRDGAPWPGPLKSQENPSKGCKAEWELKGSCATGGKWPQQRSCMALLPLKSIRTI